MQILHCWRSASNAGIWQDDKTSPLYSWSHSGHRKQGTKVAMWPVVTWHSECALKMSLDSRKCLRRLRLYSHLRSFVTGSCKRLKKKKKCSLWCLFTLDCAAFICTSDLYSKPFVTLPAKLKLVRRHFPSLTVLETQQELRGTETEDRDSYGAILKTDQLGMW